MKSFVVATLCVAALAPRAARGQDLGDLESLLNESVVSTASKSAERASTAPAQIINITSDQLRGYGMRTVDEALTFLGVGVHVAATNQYDLDDVEVGARGVLFRDGGSRVLVLVDGHITNSQIDGRSWVTGALGVPIELIDHIEVILGPGSVMYGSSAFLAVVNVVTKRAREMNGEQATASVTLQPPQGDNRRLTSAGGEDSLGVMYRLSVGVGRQFHLFGKNAEVVAQAEWQVGDSGSYRVGPQLTGYLGGVAASPGDLWKGTVSHSVNAPAIHAAVHVGDWRLAAQANSFDRGAPLVGSTYVTGSNFTVRHFGIDLRNTANLGKRFTLTSRIYADASYENQRRVIASCGTEFLQGACAVTDERLSQWLGLEEQGSVDWWSNGKLVTTIGLDARGRRSQADSGAFRELSTGKYSQLIGNEYLNSFSALGGLFAQQVYQPLPWLTINVGLRLDLDQLFGAHLSPRAALVFTPFKGNTLKLMYAEAFRAPTPLEALGGGVLQIPPMNLQPEVVRSVELEASQRWASGRVSLNGFVSFYEQLLGNRPVTDAEFAKAQEAGEPSPLPASAFTVLDNLGRARSYGGSLSFDQRLPHGVSVGLNLLVSYSETETPTGEWTHLQVMTPSWFGNARILWQPRPDGFSLGFVASVLGARTPVRTELFAIDPIHMPASADLRLTGTLPIPRVRGLSARLIADFNTDGRAPVQIGGSFMGLPGRAELIPLPRSFVLMEARYEY